MSAQKVVIVFNSLYQLWNFARKINAINMEINTFDKILTCPCSEDDLKLVQEYGGTVIGQQESSHSFRQQ